MKFSLAGSAWWRRREIRAGTAEKAVIRPVSLPLSRTETWGKLPGSPACLCARFPGACFLVPRMRGLGLWHSVPVLFVGLVPSCGSGPPASSGFVLRVCFQKEATTQGTDPKTGFFSDRPTTCKAGSPWWSGMRSDDPRIDLLAGTPFFTYCMTVALVVAAGYILWSLSWPLLSSSSKPTGGGLVEEPPRVERALRGSCSSFSRGAHAPRQRLSHGTTALWCVTR